MLSQGADPEKRAGLLPQKPKCHRTALIALNFIFHAMKGYELKSIITAFSLVYDCHDRSFSFIYDCRERSINL